jgi:hypothetical protein
MASTLEASHGFFFVSVTFFSTMIGGIFILRRVGVDINLLFAFAAGAHRNSFFDTIPEAAALSATTRIQLNLPTSTIVIVFLFFHNLDQCFLCLNTKKDEHHGHAPQTSGIVKTSGFTLHSFFVYE